MEGHSPKREDVPGFIRVLMPNAGDEELRDAHQTVKDYIDIVIRIFERRARENTGADSPEERLGSKIADK